MLLEGKTQKGFDLALRLARLGGACARPPTPPTAKSVHILWGNIEQALNALSREILVKIPRVLQGGLKMLERVALLSTLHDAALKIPFKQRQAVFQNMTRVFLAKTLSAN